MITSSREEDLTTKQEGNTVDIGKNSNKSSTGTSTSWTRLKDPRIVRVSRAFGGKDRHSKVCTVRGLRDRRVRLSVPTAIQLYDLQDRLGLNQPSKVVDWLLNVAKHEIDELPPLQIPPGNFSQIHQPFQANLEIGTSQSEKEGLKMNNSMNWDDQLGLNRSDFWNKSKEVETETAAEKENWNQRNEEEKQVGTNNVSATNFFQRPNNHSSIPGLLNNVAPYNSSFYRWDVPNSSFSLSHIEDHHQNFNVVPLPTGSQVLVCPSGTAQVPYFPSHVATSSVEFNPKQINQFQMLSSSTTSQNPLPNSLSPSLYSLGQSTRVPLHLSMASKQFFPSHDSTSGSQSNNNEDFSPK